MDDNVRSVQFLHQFFPGEGVQVQALIKIAGQEWQDVADWTDFKQPHYFCRDKAAERIEDLVIIISNSSLYNTLSIDYGSPELIVTNVGCWRWTGTVTTVAQYVGTDITETSTVNFTFTNLASSGTYFPEGSVNWSHTGTWGACTGQANGSYTFTSDELIGSMLVNGYWDWDEQGAPYQGRVYSPYADQSWTGYTIPYICPDPNDNFDMDGITTLLWDAELVNYFRVNSDGITIEGTNTFNWPDVTETYEWHFEAQREE
jgi:hypothetical protein